jgi:hypothetical protein
MVSILTTIPRFEATLWFRQVVFFSVSTLDISSTWIRAAVSEEGRCCSLVMEWTSL